MFVHFSCTSLSMPYFSNNTKKGIQKLIKMSPPKCWKKTQDLSPKIVLDWTQIVIRNKEKSNSKLARVQLKNWTSNSLPKNPDFWISLWPNLANQEKMNVKPSTSPDLKNNTNPWIVFNASLKLKFTLGQSKRKNNLKRHFFVHFFTNVLFLQLVNIYRPKKGTTACYFHRKFMYYVQKLNSPR